jgi:glutathione S-transferase
VLTLYAHPLSSYCWKVLVALYEMGTPFQQVLVDGLPRAHPALSGFWPIGKMPLLHDAARDQAVPEASIIIEYLQRHHPGARTLIPGEAAPQIEARLWDRVFDLYVHTPLQKLVSDRLRPDEDKDPAGVAEAKALLDTAYAMLDDRMATREWVAGEAFTLAECAAMPALFYAQAAYPFAPRHPALGAYLDRLTDRPSARRTIGEARPYFRFFPFHDGLDPRFTHDE